MDYKSVSCAAPGSVMVFGEHSILHGGTAMVAAIDRELMVTLTPRKDQRIKIISTNLGEYTTDLQGLTIEPPFEFILSSIMHFKDKLQLGFNVEVKSMFSHLVGLGSSAAVTAAMTEALFNYTQQTYTARQIFDVGLSTIQQVQKVGSGSDLAASVFGGLIHYQMEPFFVERIQHQPNLQLIYCGYKTPTTEVLKTVANKQQQSPALHQAVYNAMAESTQLAVNGAYKGDWQIVAEQMHCYQGLMQALGVSSSDLQDIIQQAEANDEVLASKISGSGLGDCVIALCKTAEPLDLDLRNSQRKLIPITLTKRGVTLVD